MCELRGWRAYVHEASVQGWLREGCREPLEFQPRVTGLPGCWEEGHRCRWEQSNFMLIRAQKPGPPRGQWLLGLQRLWQLHTRVRVEMTGP